MMNAFDWNAHLHRDVPWANVLPVVEREVRAHLATLLPDKTLSTRELVEALYPLDAVRGDGEAVRQRLFRALLSKKFMEDCRTKSAKSKVFMGRQRFPWLWHKPEVKRCPHCGGEL